MSVQNNLPNGRAGFWETVWWRKAFSRVVHESLQEKLLVCGPSFGHKDDWKRAYQIPNPWLMLTTSSAAEYIMWLIIFILELSFPNWQWSRILCGDFVSLPCEFDIPPPHLLVWIGQLRSLHRSHLIQNLPSSSPSVTQSISSMRARMPAGMRSRLLVVGKRPVLFF